MRLNRRGSVKVSFVPHVGHWPPSTSGRSARKRRWQFVHSTSGSVKAASSLVLADVFLQREAAGVFVDRHELIARRPWVRGLLTHLVALGLFARYEPSRMIEIEMTYRTLGRQLAVLSQLREGEPMPVEDWLLTESRYFAAALAIFREEGRSAVKRALKLRSKSEGPLSEEEVLKLFPSLRSIRFDETEPQAAVESLE